MKIAVRGDEVSILIGRWSAMDDRMQRALMLPPLRAIMAPGELAEVSRMGRFVVGQKVLQDTLDWLLRTFQDVRREHKRRIQQSDAHDRWAEAE